MKVQIGQSVTDLFVEGFDRKNVIGQSMTARLHLFPELFLWFCQTAGIIYAYSFFIFKE